MKNPIPIIDKHIYYIIIINLIVLIMYLNYF
jgi:hypothetical protein